MMVIAHRGASEDAPENTLPAFELAVAGGCVALETDVRQTLDGRLVLMHDPRVDRTTDGSGLVADLTWPELERLDAGAWKHPRFAGTRAPLLSELLERYVGQVHVVLELKAPEAIPGIVRQVVDNRVGTEGLTFTSFELGHLEQLKELLPEAACGYLTRDWQLSLTGALRERGIQQVCPRADALSRAEVDAWRAEGFSIRAWRVRTDELVLRCVEAGVDGFTVDFPARAAELIAQRR